MRTLGDITRASRRYHRGARGWFSLKNVSRPLRLRADAGKRIRGTRRWLRDPRDVNYL